MPSMLRSRVRARVGAPPSSAAQGPRGRSSSRLPPSLFPPALMLGVVLLLAASVAPAPAIAQPADAASAPPSGAAPVPPLLPADRLRYERPAIGSVLRPFELPRTSFGAGHRGVDLDVGIGSNVHAAAPGVVRHSGMVAGVPWVSITHADGITTSYGPIGPRSVVVGQEVAAGEVIGQLAPGAHAPGDSGLHWGARTAAGYIDPLRLLEPRSGRPSLIGPGGWVPSDHAVTPYGAWPGSTAGGWTTPGSPVADRAGFAVPPNGNHLVVIAGLASSSRTTVIDPGHLGYGPDQVTVLSYAGRVSDPPSAGPGVAGDQTTYEPVDTWDGAGPAAAHLAAQLRAHARAHPGQAVDLVGHSQGGIVALRYLLEHHDAYDPSLPTIAHVATLASPIGGSDLATVALALDRSPGLGGLLRRLQEGGRLGGDRLPLGIPAITELAARSAAAHDLATAWEDTVMDGAAGALGMGTRVLAIGGSRDLVVSAARARPPDLHAWAGARADDGNDGRQRLERWHAQQEADRGAGGGSTADRRLEAGWLSEQVLPGGHTSVLETEAVREQLWLFLADEEVAAAHGRLSVGPASALADGVGTLAELAVRTVAGGW